MHGSTFWRANGSEQKNGCIADFFVAQSGLQMPRRCEITGKGVSSGHNVSHSVRRTKRTFKPNLQKKRFPDSLSANTLTLRVSTRGLRILGKPPTRREAARAKKRLQANDAA